MSDNEKGNGNETKENNEKTTVKKVPEEVKTEDEKTESVKISEDKIKTDSEKPELKKVAGKKIETDVSKEDFNRRVHTSRNRFVPKKQFSQKFRRKVCKFCTKQFPLLTYKDFDKLRRFISDRGKILPRRVTGNCAKHQRYISRVVKRARVLALLPFVRE